MKRAVFCAFLLVCLLCFGASGQTPKAIETDLYKSFKKINYWTEKRSADTTGKWVDSLEKANDVFGQKLKHYTTTYPFTIDQKFSGFSNSGLTINESADGQLRIYSWDTYMGGTMRDFAKVIQYKTGQKTNSILDTASGESEKYVYAYSDLYTIKVNNHPYYLALYYGIFSGKDRGEGVRFFSIENGKLIDAKLIKTQSGLHNKLYYDYDLFSIPKNVKDANIRYDPAKKTISLPVVADPGKVTGKRILYKFTGKYFEKVKN
jgi:hypothetical protein